MLAITASAAYAQFGVTSPSDARFWIGGASSLPTSGDLNTWKNTWTAYLSNVSAQTGVNLSDVQRVVNELAATHGTAKFAGIKNNINALVKALSGNKTANGQLLYALYTQLQKRQ